jgi:hypothetical protein
MTKSSWLQPRSRSARSVITGPLVCRICATKILCIPAKIEEEALRTLFFTPGLVSPYLATAKEHLDSLISGIDKVGLYKLSRGESGVGSGSFWDLGCGDGVALIEIASKYGVPCIGVELDAALCGKAEKAALDCGVESLVQIRSQDFTSFTSAKSFDPTPSVVFLFLLPAALERIRPLLETLMNEIDGLVIIVEVWALEAWKERLFHVENSRFYFYRKPSQ